MLTSFKKHLASALLIVLTSVSLNVLGQASSDAADLFSGGVSFGGGMGAPGISYNLLPNYSGTNTPNITLNYERKFSRTFGVGIVADYSSANYTGNNIPYNVANPGTTTNYTGTVTDKLSGSYYALGSRLVYHLPAGDSFDPYAGLILGVTFTSTTHNITDTTSTVSIKAVNAGILLGAFIGVRYYISDQFAVWIEGDYSGIPSYLGNIGVTYQLSHF